MATWHQLNARRRGAYRLDNPGMWTVVSDPPGRMSSSRLFSDEAEARAYAASEAHAFVLPPRPTQVIYPRRTKHDNPKVAPLVAKALAYLEGDWGRLNPYWKTRAYVDVYCRGGRYRAAVRYSSDQGTSTVTVFYE